MQNHAFKAKICNCKSILFYCYWDLLELMEDKSSVYKTIPMKICKNNNLKRNMQIYAISNCFSFILNLLIRIDLYETSFSNGKFGGK